MPSEIDTRFNELTRDVAVYLHSLKETGIRELPIGLAKKPRQRIRHPSLSDIQSEIEGCTKCGLSRSRKNIVFGRGNPDADLVFVGEAPGKEEDLSGKPFVGQAGKLLDKIITAMSLGREDVYICNVIKCRPPGNRDPLPGEIEACQTFLLAQLKAIQPRLICALGKFAAQTLLATDDPISKLRGRIFAFHGIKLACTYHPAHLLYHPADKRLVWKDMQMVLKALAQ